MTSAPSLAAVLASGEPERLYSGLSVLVSVAVGGDECRALATFRALELILDADLVGRVGRPRATPGLSSRGREKFAASLAELRETARELDALRVYACAASVETMDVTAAEVEQRLDGVISTPRFLRELAGAPLIFV